MVEARINQIRPDSLVASVLLTCIVLQCCVFVTHFLNYAVVVDGSPPSRMIFGVAYFYPIGVAAVCSCLIYSIAGPALSRNILGFATIIVAVAALLSADGTVSWNWETNSFDNLFFLHWIVAAHVASLALALVRQKKTLHPAISQRGSIALIDYFVAVGLIALVLAISSQAFYKRVDVKQLAALSFVAGVCLATASLVLHRTLLAPQIRKRWLAFAVVVDMILSIGIFAIGTQQYIILLPDYDPGMPLYDYMVYYCWPDVLGMALGLLLAKLHVLVLIRWLGFRMRCTQETPSTQAA